MANNRRQTRRNRTEPSQRQVKRIDVLPDDVLLEILDFYLNVYPLHEVKTQEAWQPLVHVCRRWRSLIFGSPRRLDLRLVCTPKTPARDALDIWPALPLIVNGNGTASSESSDTDNVIAALEQSNRICQVSLSDLQNWQIEQVSAAMQVSFPELRTIWLSSLLLHGETPPVIPDSFLGRSSPRLELFHLDGIPFPGLPKLILSADHLFYLSLTNIPHSGYIPPKAIVALLCNLSSLNTLSLEFRSPQSRPDWETRSLPPPKRSILSALYQFYFKGVTEYLEELVTHFDAPHLGGMDITFFNQIDFDCPRLAQFINCTSALRAPDEAHVQFDEITACVELGYWTSEFDVDNFLIKISRREPDWQLSSIEQVCKTSLPPLYTVEDLYIERYFGYSRLVWKDDAIENTLWLELLLSFTAVKNLYLSKEFAPGIAIVLKELAGITEVLSSLQNIFVEGLEPSGPFQENIGQFVAARQLSGHPITISFWDIDLM